MKNDYENIEVSSKLKSQTALKAEVALHKKRFRLITASSLAAVVCTVIAMVFVLGGEPLPDIVVQSSIEGQGSYQENSGNIDEYEALSYARQRHVKVFKLSKIESNEQIEINFDENGTFVTPLEYENIAGELSDYGFSYEPPSEGLGEDYQYYMVAFHSPSYQYRYVYLGIRFLDDKKVFEYISIDNDPAISDEYGLSQPADDGSVNMGYLVAFPPTTQDTPLTAEQVLWSDLSDTKKTEAVIDTVLLNNDLDTILTAGVENSLTYELAILKKVGQPAIDYLRQYYSAPVIDNPGMDIARYMFYSLLNNYQLENYDTSDPEQAIKKLILTSSMVAEDRTPDCLIIPEIYVSEQILGQETPSILGFASVFSFNMPHGIEERNFFFNIKLSKNSDGTWDIIDIEIDNYNGIINEYYTNKYPQPVEKVGSGEIRNEQYYSAQELYKTLTTYIPPVKTKAVNAIGELVSIPIAIKEENAAKSGIVFSSNSPMVIKTEDYEKTFEQYGIAADSVCHTDASQKLTYYNDKGEYFDTYIVLFPSSSEYIRYDEVALMSKGRHVSFFYTHREEDASQRKAAVKGFLVAVAKEAECESFSAEEKDWNIIEQEYKIEILVDTLLYSPSKWFDREHPYKIAPEQLPEISEIYYMGYPAISVLRDMRYEMDLSGAITDPNKASLLDGLINMLMQYQVSYFWKNTTADTAITNYLYEFYDGLDNQPINTCLLFAFSPFEEDYSQFDDGYITYYMMIYEDRIISIHENDSLFYAAKIKVKKDEDEIYEVVSFERAMTEDETYALLGNKASSYYSMLAGEEAVFLTRNTQNLYRDFLGDYTKARDESVSQDLNEITKHLLKNYDMGMPESAINAELIYHALSVLNFRSDYPIVPASYLFKTIREMDENGRVVVHMYGYAIIYSFPPLSNPIEYGAPFYAKLSESTGSGIRVFDSNEITFAQNEGEAYEVLGEYINDYLDLRLSHIDIMKQEIMENYKYLKIDFPQNNTFSFASISEYLASKYTEISSTYPAISRDISRCILDKSKNDNALQIAAVYPLSEDFDNPITVAVLAATYDGTTTESLPAKLYVVKAEYDRSTWALKNIESEERQTLSSDEFTRLQYRSFYEVYEVLFRELTASVEDVNSRFDLNLPLPLARQEELAGGYLNLEIKSGIARFLNVSRLIRAEEGAGTLIPIWLSEENPTELSGSRFAKAVQNAEWTEVGEGELSSPYAKTGLGFLGYIVNIQLENENGLYKFEYIFDTVKNRVSLTVNNDKYGTEYYTAKDRELCISGIDTFSISTDVSEYMIEEEKGPTLPYYREELRYLTAIVGDMPGGVYSVETSISDAIKELGFSNSAKDSESDIINWAETFGNVLSSTTLEAVSKTPQLTNPDISWVVTLAAQEGIGKLQIIGYADTKMVYIRKTYRLYGSLEVFETMFASKSETLYDTLCELSFGEIPCQ